MTKLLKGDFIRLFKSKVFRLGVVFMLAFAGYIVYNRWNEMHKYPDYDNYPDSMVFVGTMFIGIVIAVVIGGFIGADYKNGTLRNKLIIGHSRLSMYLSNLIVCISASMIMHAVWLVVILAGEKLGLMRRFVTSYTKIISAALISFLMVAAFGAVFLMICMLIASKSVGSVTVLILSFVMLMAVMTLQSSLESPEYYEPYTITYTNEDGEEVEEYFEGEKNPYYTTGIKRKIYEFLYDFIPNGQIAQISDMESISDDEKELFSMYSLSLIAITTTAGILIFLKKDLK